MGVVDLTSLYTQSLKASRPSGTWGYEHHRVAYHRHLSIASCPQSHRTAAVRSRPYALANHSLPEKKQRFTFHPLIAYPPRIFSIRAWRGAIRSVSTLLQTIQDRDSVSLMPNHPLTHLVSILSKWRRVRVSCDSSSRLAIRKVAAPCSR